MCSNVASRVKVKSSVEQTPLRDENSGRPEGWPQGALRPGPASPLTPLTHRHPKTVGRRGPEPSRNGSSSFAVKRLQKSTPRRTCVVSPSGRGVGPPGRPPPGGPPSSARPPQERRGDEAAPTLPPESSGWWEQRPRETPPCSLKSPKLPPTSGSPLGPRHDHQLHETGDRGFPCPPASRWAAPPPHGEAPRPPGPASGL